MSKTKIKRKTTGFDILYRVITAIMAAAMIPIALLSKMVFIVVMHEEISSVLNTLLGTDDPSGTYVEWGFTDLFDSSSSLSLFIDEDSFSGFQFSTVWDNVYLRAVFIALVFFVIALVISLVILGFAIFSNKIKVITGLSIGGLLAMAASWISFTNFFANPLTSGEITLREIFEGMGAIASIAVGLIDITTVRLMSAFYGVFFLMLAILVWSVSVMIVNADDEKAKAEKAMAKAKNK